MRRVVRDTRIAAQRVTRNVSKEMIGGSPQCEARVLAAGYPCASQRDFRFELSYRIAEIYVSVCTVGRCEARFDC